MFKDKQGRFTLWSTCPVLLWSTIENEVKFTSFSMIIAKLLLYHFVLYGYNYMERKSTDRDRNPGHNLQCIQI